ncbi:DUF3311 domain-containing protein [Streptomyces roseoviridis]|uniref:DUF3311 domain-containing protein n=1 Tax=Streptomyces roseoviridis TaxID=67361 RepID=A0ABV5QQE9_9ACTN
MSTPEKEDTTVAPPSERSRWHWILLVAVVVPLIPFLYNHDEPRLFGFPAFYWIQLVFGVLSMAATTAVYQLTKGKR